LIARSVTNIKVEITFRTTKVSRRIDKWQLKEKLSAAGVNNHFKERMNYF
jgi:hypothetical protein